MHVVIYAAKSTADRHGSIPDQVKACRAEAASRGWTVEDVKSDEAASAYTGNRGPGLEAAMNRAAELAKTHGKAGLLVWHSNRIARGGADSPDASRHLVEYLFWANRSNVELHSVQDDPTFANPILAAVMGQMAYEESKIKAKNVTAGMARRRGRGLHTGGAVFGYLRDPEMGLTPDPATAPTVVRIFELVAAGKSQAEVARILNDEGVPTLRGATWQQGTITTMLRRRTYLGEIPADGFSDRQQVNVPEKWTDGAHEAIVSADLWKAANAARERAASRQGRRGGPRPKAGHLLPGYMLRHAVCNCSMTPRSGDTKQDGTISGWYVCSGRKQGLCEGFTIGMSEVDDTIVDYLAAVGIDVDASLELVRKASAARQETIGAELEAARRDAAKADANLTRVRRDYMDGKITAEDWADLRPDLESERDAAAARVERLEAQETAAAAAPEEVIVPAVSSALELLRASMQAGDGSAVREALEALFSGFLVGELGAMPAEAVAGSPAQAAAARERLRSHVAELEAAAGRTVVDAEAQFWAEEEELRQLVGDPTNHEADPLDVGLVADENVVILPLPREDALASIVEDGRPVYLVDEEGRSAFRRLPLDVAPGGLTSGAMTNREGLARKSSAPASNARMRSGSAQRPLRTSTGSALSIREPAASATRTSRRIPRPEPSGRPTSSTARSGKRVSIRRSASRAVSAVSSSQPSAVSSSARNVRVDASSSATRMVAGGSSVMHPIGRQKTKFAPHREERPQTTRIRLPTVAAERADGLQDRSQDLRTRRVRAYDADDFGSRRPPRRDYTDLRNERRTPRQLRQRRGLRPRIRGAPLHLQRARLP